MKITAQEEYGLRCILQLASHTSGEPLAVSEIARREGLSVAYAEKLLRILARARLVRSQRGTKGGYELTRSSDAITLGDVARALGGIQSWEQICQRHPGNQNECVHTDNCTIQPVWQGITNLIFDVMDDISLSQMLNGGKIGPDVFTSRLPVLNGTKKI
jgi:Rrf2 family protein